MPSPLKRTADERDRGGASRDHRDVPSSPSGPALSSPIDQDFDDEENIVEDVIDDLDEMAEEEDGEDLYGDNMERDYRESNLNDTYDLGDAQIDDADYDGIDLAERRRIDAQLNRRDRVLGTGRSQGSRGRLPDAFLDMDSDDGPLPSARRRRNQFDEDPMDGDDDLDGDAFEALPLESLGDIKAESIVEWVTQPAIRRTIYREFKNFLLEHTDKHGNSVYGARVKQLGEINSMSLAVDYQQLVEAKAILAYFVAVAPAEVLKVFDSVALEVVQLHYREYHRIHPEIYVRITNLPTVLSLRELREIHLNSLVRVSGVVTRRTGVFPQLKFVRFTCVCGQVLGPYVQDSNAEVKVSFCHNCQRKGPFKVNTEKTQYRNYQKLTIQESPGSVPAGRLPRRRDVILLADLVDSARPGDDVDITGIYKHIYDGNLNAKNGFPVFATVLEANTVQRRDPGQSHNLTEEDEAEIKRLAQDRRIIDRLISSIAPSIFGHRDAKTAIAASLFGGVAKDINGKHAVRGDINVLLLGDPGTAKSQLLKYSEKTADRAVFATGQGASAVGLTATVRRDPVTQEWTLEGGALVLADKGTCLIDEFDKMSDQDRTSIHEAMEQQSISISKAGIVTTLRARCAVVAAANPVGGRYNATIPFSQNVDLTEPILSRFDVLCVIRDTVNPDVDERLAQFVIDSHMRAHDKSQDKADVRTWFDTEDGAVEPIPQDLLRKYIMYARRRQPRLLNIDENKIARVYSELRRESLATGSLPITVRHLESIIRLSEAFAKMRLSDYVSAGDVNRAIRVVVSSFVGAQKISIRRSLQRSFMKYTI